MDVKPFSRVAAVTFDVGGTLLEPWPSVGDVYASIAAEYGWSALSPEGLNQSFANVWQAKDRFDYSRASWRRLVGATFARVGATAPSEKLFAALFERFARASAWRIFPDVV